MAKKRYMMSNGLAFSEQKDMETLSKMAAKGWILKRFAFLGYQLEQGAPEDAIFSIDYRDLKDEERAEYIEIFEIAGWSHVCSEAGTHLFKAAPGTKPIYSDKESSVDKVFRQGKYLVPLFVFCLLLSAVAYTISHVTEGIMQSIFHYVFLASIVLTFPVMLTAAAVVYHYLTAKIRRYN